MKIRYNTNPRVNFIDEVRGHLNRRQKLDNRIVGKIAVAHGFTDKTEIKELTELSIVLEARFLARSNNTKLERFNQIVDLYYNQSNLSHKTSQSMLLQQYSTPAPIGYLAGVYTGADQEGRKLFEPSAGNGLLTIAAPLLNYVDVNEIDSTRRENLKVQGYANVTAIDASSPIIKRGREKKYDCVITNPPFGTTDPVMLDGFKINTLDHIMALYALDCMKDRGKAAFIIGGHTIWDSKKRIQSGKNRIFFNYLYKHYHVEDVINIDGKKLYSRQGTGFDTRLILVNGRKATPGGVAPLKTEKDTVVRTYDDLYERVMYHINTPDTDMLHIEAEAAMAELELLNLNNGLGMPYTPTSNACVVLDTHVPDMMAHETFSALDKIKLAVGGDIDKFVQHRLGYASNKGMCKALAAEQIDAVAMAIYNIEARGQGMIIGDQTGIGKGRQAASLIRYAVKQGKKPVFLTESPNLFSDLYRDLVAIGSADLVPFIVNETDSKTGKLVEIKDEDGNVIHTAFAGAKKKSIIKSKAVPKEYHYVVSTYSQFNNEEKYPAKPAWLRAVGKGSVLVLDEAHNASGEGNTGTLLQDVTKLAAGVLFLSATYAKRPDSMPLYAMKTAMRDANLTKEGLVEAIKRGGVALQEVLSSQLVQEGQMIRRERSYEGIEVNYVTLDKSANDPTLDKEQEHKAIADNITSIMRDIIEFQEKYVAEEVQILDGQMAEQGVEVEERAGTEKAGVDNSPYFSKLFQVINQMLFAIKAETVADRAIKHLREGKKPVIAFASTMESFLSKIEDEKGNAVTNGSVIDADFSTVLQTGLDGVMRYSVVTPEGDTEHGTFSISDFSPEAQMRYFEISGKIKALTSGISISPIDVVKQRIEAAGFSVAEVTGRKFEIQLNHKTGKGLVMQREALSTTDAFRGFNNNQIDVLMINQSGATGASAHAVPVQNKKTKQWIVAPEQVKQRVMLVLQAELDINKEVQKRGRTNRTGQILTPIYDYMISAIPAEKRLMMMLQKKLKSLDANTSSNQKQSESLLSVPDFLNKYGDIVVHDYLKANPEMNKKLGSPLDKGKENLAHKVSGRVAVLSCADQEAFYNEITTAYDDFVEDLKRKDEYDLEVEAMDLDAETIGRKIEVAGRGGASVFAENTVLETVRARVLKKPYTKTEVANLVQEALGDKTAAQHRDEFVTSYRSFMLAQVEEEAEKLKAETEKRLGNIRDDKKIVKLPAEEKEAAIHQRIEELLAARDAAIQKMRETANNRFGYLTKFVNFFTIGRGILYKVDKETLAKGVFIGYRMDMKAPNPYLPSKVRMRFAIAHSTKYIEVPASHDLAMAIKGASEGMYDSWKNNMLDYWEDAARDSNVDTKIRYILTGNLLQAVGAKGKLISYTLKGGGEAKGILLPEAWVPKENSTTNVPISAALPFLKSMVSGRSVVTGKGVSILRQGSHYVLLVQGTKDKGGWLFLDKFVMGLVRKGMFEKQSTKMRAEMELEQIDALVNWLQENHSDTLDLPEHEFNRIQQALPAKTAQVWPKLKVPEIVEVDDSDILLLELEAEAAMAELELLNLNARAA